MYLLRRQAKQKQSLQLTWVDLLLALVSGVVSLKLSAPLAPFQRRASFYFRPLVYPWPLDSIKELMESEE